MRQTARNTFGNPFWMWTDFARKVTEMSMASAQVIAHRTTRMAAAGPLPNARDRKEFTRMGQEKVEASAESARAMATHMTTMNMNRGMRAFSHMMNATTAFMSLAASRTPAQFVARQARLAETVARSALTAADLATSTARLAKRGLKPVHTRATANARRLRKR
jgi:hypothetical protein